MKKKNYLLIVAAIVTLNACMPPLYHASMTNAPMFSKKKELNVTGGYGKTGTDIQAAYSLSNHSGIMLNCSFGTKIHTDIDSGSALTTNSYKAKTFSGNSEYKDGYHFNFVEGGYGLYLKPMGESDLRAEVFGLIGTGYAESFNELINYSASGNYMRYSVQGDLGYAGKITEGALSLRVGYLDFSGLNTSESKDMRTNTTSIDTYSANQTSLNGRATSFFIDPAVTFRAGYKGVKIFLQSGISVPFSDHLSFGWEKSWGSIGIQFRIPSDK